MLSLAKQGQLVERVADVVDYEEDRAEKVVVGVRKLLFGEHGRIFDTKIRK